jgi:hypothetical protein
MYPPAISLHKKDHVFEFHLSIIGVFSLSSSRFGSMTNLLRHENSFEKKTIALSFFDKL